MRNLKPILSQLHNNLNILREREAKYAENAPLDLLNQITDHQKAIALTEQALAGEITEEEWQEETATLLAFTGGQVVRVEIEADTLIIGDQHNHLAPEPGPGPPNTRFWRWAVSAGIIVALIAGLIAIVSDTLGIRSQFFPPPTYTPTSTATNTPTPTNTPLQTHTPTITPTPLAFAPAAADETLIVIPTFHETNPTKNEPHVKIKRGIEEAAQEIGLDALRVEIDPTELTADQREEAEALAEQYNASMVIWGEDTGGQVLVNFVNLKTLDCCEAAYAGFVTRYLPAHLTFLSLFAVGQTYLIREEYPAAINVVTKALDSLPSETSSLDGIAEAYVSRGTTYANMGQYEEALIDFNQAIDLNATFAEAYVNRGKAYFYLGEYKAALTDYSRAIDLNATFAETYVNRGATYYNLGQPEAALSDFNQAIDLNPEYAGAYNNRGFIYSNLGQYEQALTDFEQALFLSEKQLGPDHPNTILALKNIAELRREMVK